MDQKLANLYHIPHKSQQNQRGVFLSPTGPPTGRPTIFIALHTSHRYYPNDLHQAGDLLVSIPTFQMTVLQFADDTAIFTPAHVQNIKIIHSILNVFGETSGLKINLTKSGYIPIAILADLKPIIDSAM
jgi:hypothetical protein